MKSSFHSPMLILELSYTYNKSTTSSLKFDNSIFTIKSQLIVLF